MKTYKIVKLPQYCVDTVVCNCCGETLSSQDEIIEISHDFGYYAKKFYDGQQHKGDICEECYFKWVETFEHTPEI